MHIQLFEYYLNYFVSQNSVQVVHWNQCSEELVNNFKLYILYQKEDCLENNLSCPIFGLWNLIKQL